MNLTPLRSQYLEIKKRYPGIIVFFRLGDFYETFDDDAKVTSTELEIALTSREMGKGNRVPLAGIPYHAVDNYLGRLIGKGYKVAICEQMTPPGKGLVDREVIRIVTPGTVIEPGLLKDKNNNYLAAIITEGNEAGVAFVDITTGEFAATQLPKSKLDDEITRLSPAEMLMLNGESIENISLSTSITNLEDYWFDIDTAKQLILDHFKVATLDGYGVANQPLAIRAAGAIVQYIGKTQKTILDQINRLSTYSTQEFMTLDIQTRRNLDIFLGSKVGTTTDSLISIIDLTVTAMGGRLLKKWLGQPLLDIKHLKSRHDLVDWFYHNLICRQRIRSLFDDFADLERIINRIRNKIASPRDLNALGGSLSKISQIRDCLQEYSAPHLLVSQVKPCPEVVDLIARSLSTDIGANLERGGVIKGGFSGDLDGLRQALSNAKNYLANLEKQERERTGIKSLKVGYNRIFGYYIEVSNTNLNLVPADYIRKQTLVNAERYLTTELKEYEAIILNAQEKIIELELAIFVQLCSQVAANSEQILLSATTLAEVDVILSLSEIAVRNSYTRPIITTDAVLSIKGGRHPVIERTLGADSFIPNDTYLDNDSMQIVVLTGPNMAGKSTYLKQVAMIVLLAQIGSFVPAESAIIGIVDRIFTRIGAQEDLASGQSTFMVEMVETANILNNATTRSLIILDEVGRGTSTYDGLSIAWSVVEYLHNQPRLKSKTLFATHYHELVELADYLPRVKNFNLAVTEEKGKVIFLRKVIPGGADKSYGIHVGQMAGLPASVINRAREILKGLESKQRDKSDMGQSAISKTTVVPQLSLFNDRNILLEEIAAIDVDSLSPLEAITKLYGLKQRIKKEQFG